MTDKEFIEGWKHFCNCIDFSKSALDAEAIRFMNEMPAKVIIALQHKCELPRSICEALNRGDGAYRP